MTCGLFPLGWLKIEIQQVGFGQCDTQISVGWYKVGHEKTDRCFNGGTWDPYKWPKINGFHWGYSTLVMGLITSIYNWGRGPPCSDCSGVSKSSNFCPTILDMIFAHKEVWKSVLVFLPQKTVAAMTSGISTKSGQWSFPSWESTSAATKAERLNNTRQFDYLSCQKHGSEKWGSFQ